MDIIKSTGMFIFAYAALFIPLLLLGKFIERERRHRAIGDGRRLLFNGATTCRRTEIKKNGWGEKNEEWKKYVSIV